MDVNGFLTAPSMERGPRSLQIWLSAETRAPSAAQLAAGFLLDFGDEALREALNLGIRQAALLRLQDDSDRKRLFAFRQTRPLIDIEQSNF
jgi:hypothetical protein